MGGHSKYDKHNELLNVRKIFFMTSNYMAISYSNIVQLYLF